MKLAFVVNDVQTRKPGHATIRLAARADAAGHEVWLTGVGSLSCDTDGTVHAQAWAAGPTKHRSPEAYLKSLLGTKGRRARVSLSSCDVVMLRSNPAAEAASRSWGQYVGILFGRLLVSHGVLVINDPEGLARGLNKIYLQEFPEEVKPETLITRARDDVKKFVAQHGKVVAKRTQNTKNSL